MGLNERTLDRIIKMVNTKFPFIFDVKVTQDRFSTYSFVFTADLELVREISPESQIDWDYIKQYSDGVVKITELFLDYNRSEHFEDPQYLLKLGDEISNQILMMIKVVTPHNIHSEHNPIQISYKFK
jgi:hypothetical protein